jgi:two-component system response regulator AtoC
MEGKRTILIVEDELSWQNVLKDILGRQGYQVHVAENYHEAVKLLQKQSYDLAIVDVRIDEFQCQEEGLKLLAEMGTIAPETSAIVLTGYELDDKKVRDILIEYGALDFITKIEWDANKFLLTVSRALEPALFATVQLEAKDGSPLAMGNRYALRIACQSRRPEIQEVIGLPVRRERGRPTRLLVTLILPVDIEVYPSIRQEIVIAPDDESTTLRFDIIPRAAGQYKFGISFEHNLRPITTYWLAMEVK